MPATTTIQPPANGTQWHITPFRMRVLKAAYQNEYTGSIEVSLTMYGYPDALEDHNVRKALHRLHDDGYFDMRDFVVTEKGLKALGIVSESIQPTPATASECTCTHKTANGRTFRWSNNPNCKVHGENSPSFDWGAFLQMSGRLDKDETDKGDPNPIDTDWKYYPNGDPEPRGRMSRTGPLE